MKKGKGDLVMTFLPSPRRGEGRVRVAELPAEVSCPLPCRLSLLLFTALFFAAGCSGRDPAKLAQNYFKAFQRGNWHAQYGMLEPSLRSLESREDFAGAQIRQAAKHKVLSFELVDRPAQITSPWRAFLKVTIQDPKGKQETAWRGLSMVKRGSRWWVMDTPAAREAAAEAYRAAEYSRATVLLQSILRLNPSDAESLDMLGYVFRDNGALRNNLEMAIESHRQAVDLEPKNPDWHNSLGNDYRLLGWFTGAVNEIRKAIALEKRAAFYVWLGVAYGTGQRVEEARSAWGQALKLEPDNAQAHAFLEKIR